MKLCKNNQNLCSCLIKTHKTLLLHAMKCDNMLFKYNILIVLLILLSLQQPNKTQTNVQTNKQQFFHGNVTFK